MSEADRPLPEAERRRILEVLEEVHDPEIPTLSVVDLGIVRGIGTTPDGATVVRITPTYTGCPATRLIELEVRAALDRAGFGDVRVETVLSPPWTTDWITERGREKLRQAGIAPPERGGDRGRMFAPEPEITCPRCSSRETERVSEFGSTACKALYRCRSCREPFEYFKCL